MVVSKPIALECLLGRNGLQIDGTPIRPDETQSASDESLTELGRRNFHSREIKLASWLYFGTHQGRGVNPNKCIRHLPYVQFLLA